MQLRESMGHGEWIRFKAWTWFVGGTEVARGILGVSAETFEVLWLRLPVTGSMLAKVRSRIAGGRDAVA